MSIQENLFGDEKPVKITRVKKKVDKRLADFYRVYGRHITPYALVLLRHEDDKATIPDDHALMSSTEAQKRITGMCLHFGMNRTVCDELLVASGNGRFLYMLSYGGDSITRKRD